MMNYILDDIAPIILSYLKSNDVLILSCCSSKKEPWNIDRKHEIKMISARLLLPYIIPHIKNPLFTNNQDIIEFLDDIEELEYENRIKCMFAYLCYYTRQMIDKQGLSSFDRHGLNYIPLWKKFSCKESHFAFSNHWWGTNRDISEICDQPIRVSVVYRSTSYQLRQILNSSQLKALVG